MAARPKPVCYSLLACVEAVSRELLGAEIMAIAGAFKTSDDLDRQLPQN